jgi:hypothetical protein
MVLRPETNSSGIRRPCSAAMSSSFLVPGCLVKHPATLQRQSGWLSLPEDLIDLRAADPTACNMLLFRSCSARTHLAFLFASVHDEMDLIQASGLTPFQVLQSATVNPAKFFGEDNRFGTATVGKRADLLLVKDNPLTDLRPLDDRKKSCSEVCGCPLRICNGC